MVCTWNCGFGNGFDITNENTTAHTTGIDDVTGEALSQREDDKPHVVKARLEEYASMIAPLLAYYKELQQKTGSTIVAEFKGSESDVIYKSVKPFVVNDMKFPTV